MDEEETGEDASEEAEEEGEQKEEAVEQEELKSTVSARSFGGFSVWSTLNSDQSKVFERPSRRRSRTLLLRGSETGAAILRICSCLGPSDMDTSRGGIGSGVF